MNNFFLEDLINKKLNNCINFKDYCPNGLQIEGCSEINKIVTGVTACQKLLEKAIFYKAHAIIVHHGYFWKNESKKILGIKRKRLKLILKNNINLYCWHLPLDIDLELGNNILLGKELGIDYKGMITPFVLWGYINKKITPKKFIKKIKKKLNRTPFYYGNSGPEYINKIAWCTGKGQSFIHYAVKNKIDTYITGEVSEETIHIAEENNIHFFSLGHHATEKFGIFKLGQWISKKDPKLQVKFIDIYNPI